ncbi:phosphotransferase enzyme family protein [Ruegeria sp. Ofav3-42]|uniref:phosphotransferase enzyme family protein n=1 Tax=Ruegeria sp. Ofav3-42 TaxID=2917759 RepID=UPI001EF7440B|nr:phosphotransferase [Ruegeria sp. Ofav3-42]MCG7521944.1 phosphotransferase [Ruegeria sp. Ofav3-42]
MTDFFTRPLGEQLAAMEAAATQALDAWDLNAGTLSLIKHRENAVYKLELKNNARYALRVHRPEYHSNAELNSELLWTTALNEAGVPTPTVIPAADGTLFKTVTPEGQAQAFQVDILLWSEGTPIGNFEEGTNLDVDGLVSVFKEIGRLMAQVHKHATEWKQPDGFTRHGWDIDGLTGPDPFWGRYWDLDLLSSEQKDLMLKVREKLRGELKAFGTGKDRFGLIHADLMPENILQTVDDICILDFDDAGFGWFMYDIATSVFFHADEPHFDDVVGALIEGYSAVRELPEEHIAMLPSFMMARGVALLGWAHTRKETQTAKDLGPVVAEGVCAFAEQYLST